ncbi:MAG: TolC family protein [Gemmatimonadaceae bacterium]|nr:TolC family protein [Gemmatimonadaceae bacterium]
MSRRSRFSLSAIAFLLCAGVATSASAQSSGPPAPSDTLVLALHDVRRLALARNPSLLGVRQETAIARGALRQTRVLRSNPEFAAQSAGGTLGTAEDQLQFTVLQEIEFAGQRGLRTDVARFGSARASFSLQEAGRLTIAESSAAFYRAVAAERRLSVASEALALVERLLAAVQIQLREGEISRLDANLAVIEAGRARGRVLGARRAAATAELELRLLIGLESGAPFRLVADSTGDSLNGLEGLSGDSLLVLALTNRPDLAAAGQAVREAETLLALGRREAFPNLRIGVGGVRSPDDGSLQFGPAWGLTLPIFNRNQGLRDQRRALVDQAQFARRSVRLRVETDVAVAEQAYRTAVEEARVYEREVLALAHENAALLETAYGAGKIDLSTLLLLRNQLLDAEFGYWDAWLAQRDALVQLEAATGQLTPSAATLQPINAAAASPRGPTTATVRTIP